MPEYVVCTNEKCDDFQNSSCQCKKITVSSCNHPSYSNCPNCGTKLTTKSWTKDGIYTKMHVCPSCDFKYKEFTI